FTALPSSTIYTLSLHDALPICDDSAYARPAGSPAAGQRARRRCAWGAASSPGLAPASRQDQRCSTPTSRSRPGEVDDREGFFPRSEEHTSELQSLRHLVCRLLL